MVAERFLELQLPNDRCIYVMRKRRPDGIVYDIFDNIDDDEREEEYKLVRQDCQRTTVVSFVLNLLQAFLEV